MYVCIYIHIHTHTHTHTHPYISFLPSLSTTRNILFSLCFCSGCKQKIAPLFTNSGDLITVPEGLKVFENVSRERNCVSFSNNVHNEIRKKGEEILGTSGIYIYK